METVALLAELMTLGDVKLPVKAYRRRPEFHALVRNRLVKESGVLASIECDECDNPHDAAIRFDDHRQSYGWDCFDHGFLPIPRVHIEAFEIDVGALVSWIAATLSCTSRREVPFPGGVLWQVGSFSYFENDVFVFLAANLQSFEDAKAIAAAISLKPGHRRNLLITPDHEALKGFSIAGCRIATLVEVISIDPLLGIEAKQSVVAELAGIKPPRGAGRPPTFAAGLTEILEDRDLKDEALDEMRAEAREIVLVWKRRFPNSKTPSEATARRAVKEYRAGS